MSIRLRKEHLSGEVVSFQTGQRRRNSERIRVLQRAHEQAVAEQIRAAQRLEEALHLLERASLRAEQTAWALSVAEQRRTSSMSFGSLMSWLADICKVRNPGEHFCLADLVQRPEETEPRS